MTREGHGSRVEASMARAQEAAVSGACLVTPEGGEGPPYVRVAGLRVVNPPLLARDPAGGVVHGGIGPSGRPRPVRRYRRDPMAALAEVVIAHGGDGGRLR